MNMQQELLARHTDLRVSVFAIVFNYTSQRKDEEKRFSAFV